MFRKLLSIALLAFLLSGVLIFPFFSTKVEAKAKAKKKIVSKIKKVKKAKKVVRRETYCLPARTGMITQNLILNEGIEETKAEIIAIELKSLGVDDASVNIAQNRLRVKFNARELSSVDIIKRLKELGFSVKRIE